MRGHGVLYGSFSSIFWVASWTSAQWDNVFSFVLYYQSISIYQSYLIFLVFCFCNYQNIVEKIILFSQNSNWVWSGNTTITNCRQPCGTARKSRSTITRHQDHKLSKATSSLFSIKMIAILERTQSNVQQNIEQLQTPTMGITINKNSTTTEPLP